MRVKHQAQKHKMTKEINAATSWVPSVFMQKELNKARADGLISDNDQVIFPSTEWIPKPRDGFRVMFFAFLLRGLSHPAHEFLHGLLFYLWYAASPAHTKLYLAHCLFHNSLGVVPGDSSPLSSLEIPLLALPQCFIVQET
jgi:hypothetical protein